MIMVKSRAESAQNYRTFEQFLHTLCPENRTLVRTRKKLNKKLNCSSLSVAFNETCINEGLLPE